MANKNEQIKAIFSEAYRKKTARERVEYLDSKCGDDTVLRADVESLLRAHDDVDGFLESPILDIGVTLQDSALSERPGTVIDKYKLLEQIGEGGMAVVYMAEQAEPIRRKVALKIIKLGMDTKQVIARFEAERQALAMMDHPNIAKVLDAGATESGRPYFVMDLVPGVCITEYCDKNRLNIKERLSLFISVCSAVQHAHQKGIIHRDIKPSNIMVTLHDGKPVPKVIDFGIAKATNQKLTEKTLFTRYAHIIGTPAYMSPEQAELSDLDVDTRTDIYSLGVLLYELLTGTTPFSEQELREAGFLQMQKIICEAEPTKPSTKLSTLGKALTDIAKLHSSSPEAMPKLIRGDLDWIVMKSLEKERTRRYDTASALSLDVQRHLDNEPVLARAPKAMYRFQKFLRRHQYQTIAAIAITVLTVAVISISSMWNRDRTQLSEAKKFRHGGILSQAREQYARAEREAALETLRPVLASKYVGPEARLLQAGILVDNRRFGEATAVLGRLLDGPPEIAGAAHSLLARILLESESPDAAKIKEIEEHQQKAEMLIPETAEAYFLRAMTAMTVKEQLASLDEALRLDRNHYESRRLRAFTYYASRKYEKMRDDALVMTILRPGDSIGYSLRAIALRELGKYEEAIAEYDIAIALTPEGSPQHVALATQRCEILLRMADYERVVVDAQESLKLSPDRPVFQYYTFCALAALGDYDKADTVFRQIVRRAPTSRNEFRQWCSKYAFDTLDAGRSWHQQGSEPKGAAFLSMVEAEETYRSLSAKGRRLTTDGFSGHWSPDGSKLAFSLGVHGYSGVAVFDPATKETDLLIVPGKDPKWSPDGNYIAFVRDCQFLRISEFIDLEPQEQRRLKADEEIWIMKSDGTEPRHLARGGSPSWSRDSTRVYYHSRVDNMLCSISIEEQDTEPKQIMKCSYESPSLSPDEKCVAYGESTLLKVRDVASQTVVAEWPVLPTMRGGISWSPTGQELCLGGTADQIGLWIYSLGKPQPARVLDGRIGRGLWSDDGTKLVVRLGSGHSEIWIADLDPKMPTVEALGPTQMIVEHFHKMLAYYSRRIEADPLDAYAYSSRAQYYGYLHDRAKATADMRRWSAAASGKLPSDLQIDTPQNIKRVINVPFGYKIVFSAERPVNETPLLNVAFGQKGRCNMKTFQVPMLSIPLLGLCLFSGLDAPPAHADFTFGEPVNVNTTIPLLEQEIVAISCFSYDGLEMYVCGTRPGGLGGPDNWVSTRATIDSDWGPLVNLRSAINSSNDDSFESISSDGLTLYFDSDRPGGSGNNDIYMSTRVTKNDAWVPAVNLGPVVNSSAADASAWESPDGLELYFVSYRSGGYGNADICVARRTTKNAPWDSPENLGPVVNSPYSEHWISLSPDGLLLFFCEVPGAPFRPGGYGNSDCWMTRRANLAAPWQAPVNLGPVVNGPTDDFCPRISVDGHTLYFGRSADPDFSMYNIWQVPVVPITDFNSDGIVDAGDVCIMIEHWLTDYPLCDIGPMPWGDGIVDVQDLIVLAEHLFEEVPPAAPDLLMP